MGRLDELDKAWDNYYHSKLFDTQDEATRPAAIVEPSIIEPVVLPQSFKKVFTLHSNCRVCQSPLSFPEEEYFPICIACNSKLDNQSKKALPRDLKQVLMSAYCSFNTGAYSHGWAVLLQYNNTVLTITGKNKIASSKKELHIYAFSAGVISLKQPCSIKFTTEDFSTLFTVRDEHTYVTDDMVPIAIKSATTAHNIYHVNSINIPPSSLLHRAKEAVLYKAGQYSDEMIAIERK
jgi:hypothetical protein